MNDEPRYSDVFPNMTFLGRFKEYDLYYRRVCIPQIYGPLEELWATSPRPLLMDILEDGSWYRLCDERSPWVYRTALRMAVEQGLVCKSRGVRKVYERKRS